jgi:hypothetical protein
MFFIATLGYLCVSKEKRASGNGTREWARHFFIDE